MQNKKVLSEDLLRFQIVSDPQINSEGTSILFSKRVVNSKNKTVSHLFTVDLNHKVTQWTQGESVNTFGRWSSDGSNVAFISMREEKKFQIYLISTSGGEAKKVTDLPEGVLSYFKWSPDSKKIVFIFREGLQEFTEKAKKEREEKGLSQPPFIIETGWHRLDGEGYFGHARNAIYCLDIQTNKYHKIYDHCKMGFYSLDWLPDSQSLLVSHSVQPNPWGKKIDDRIFRVYLDGKSEELRGLPKGRKAEVLCSPDGTWFSYLGNEDELDHFGSKNLNLYLSDFNGKTVSCLTQNQDYCLGAWSISDTNDMKCSEITHWDPSGRGIFVSLCQHGESQVGFLDLKEKNIKPLTKGKHTVLIGNVSSDGKKMGCVYTTPVAIGEIGVLDLDQGAGGVRVLTSFNKEYLESIEKIIPEELWFTASDGYKVQAWVMKPVGFDANKKYPAVLEVHGGPHAQYALSYFHEFQLLASEGYVVVFSNPRGSKGYGEAHTEAIRQKWGDKDWLDVQAVTLWMKNQGYIDVRKIGIMGGSYGGYMTNWAVGHTHDFKAAITDRCVSNLVTMSGTGDFYVNRNVHLKGYAFGDLNSISELWHCSPISYFDKVNTPMLIIHSEGDLRCNIEQAEQVFAALQMNGVESRFVKYPVSTSHGMSRTGPADLKIHRLNEIMNWWKRHFK